MYRQDTEPRRTFKNRPNANTCEDSARSSRVSHDMLGRANHVWRASHPHEFYEGSYKSMDPYTHFDQSLGLVISIAIASHLLRGCTNESARHAQIAPASMMIPPQPSRRLQQPSCPSGRRNVLLLRHRLTQMMGLPTYPRRLSVSIFATLTVQHPTRNITTVKCSQWICTLVNAGSN